MVSDGSLKNSWGTAALITEGWISSHTRISATITTTGHTEDQEAYRSKLSGILNFIIIIDNICTKFNITEGEITAVCDGLDVIRMAMEKFTSFSIK